MVLLKNKIDIKQYIQEQNIYINRKFQVIFKEKINGYNQILNVMEYSFFPGGKRLRPLLLMEAGRLFNGDEEDLILLGLVVEMIHTYSLIHDDLPAMDNDDFRRGKLSSHKKFNEAMAILGGDALLTESFGLLSVLNRKSIMAKILTELVRASGAQGMIAGQVMDLEAENNSAVSLEYLEKLHKNKTGALITASLRIGVMSSLPDIEENITKTSLKNSKEILSNITSYGQSLGLLFQISDDILDQVGNESDLGKPVGSDQRKGKKTYVSLMGIEQARKLAQKEFHRAKSLAKKLPGSNGFFLELPRFILNRQK